MVNDCDVSIHLPKALGHETVGIFSRPLSGTSSNEKGIYFNRDANGNGYHYDFNVIGYSQCNG